MSRLIRLDQTGHTELAQWSPGDDAAFERARSAMAAELARGYFAVASGGGNGAGDGAATGSGATGGGAEGGGAGRGGVAEHVRKLPADAEIVILRRPIAGG
jgi:hypothetical protein